jgi:hypothetical protein
MDFDRVNGVYKYEEDAQEDLNVLKNDFPGDCFSLKQFELIE